MVRAVWANVSASVKRPVNQQLETTPAQVIAAVDAARRAGRDSVLLLVKRGTNPEAFVGVDISGR